MPVVKLHYTAITESVLSVSVKSDIIEIAATEQCGKKIRKRNVVAVFAE